MNKEKFLNNPIQIIQNKKSKSLGIQISQEIIFLIRLGKYPIQLNLLKISCQQQLQKKPSKSSYAFDNLAYGSTANINKQ